MPGHWSVLVLRLALAAVLLVPSAAAPWQLDSAVTTAFTQKAGAPPHRWKMLHANELRTPWTPFRIGGRGAVEVTTHSSS